MVFPDWDAVADGSRPFHVYCDACIDGFGGAFKQEMPDDSVRSIAYTSRATLDSKRHWNLLDLEADRIVWPIERLQGYVWGTKFRIFLDHKALESIGKMRDHNARVQRWLDFLTAFDYTLEYRNGSANGNAAFLSSLLESSTEHDRSGSSSLTPVDDDAIFLIRACGLHTPFSPTRGVGLSGLVPRLENAVSGGLPSTSSEFSDFRARGPRMRTDDLSAPFGRFVALAPAAVTIVDHRPGRGVFFLRRKPPSLRLLPCPL